MAVDFLIINPAGKKEKSFGRFHKFISPILPLGIGYIAGFLEAKGFSVKVIDQFATYNSFGQILKLIQDEKPRVVGFSCLTPTMVEVMSLSKEIKEIFPEILIVMGNVHAAVFDRELIEAGYCDIVVRGEGEIIMSKIGEAVNNSRDFSKINGITYKSDNQAIRNPDAAPISELDNLPYPAWHHFDLPLYKAPPMLAFNKVIIPILASRGCPFCCCFCAQNFIQKRFIKRDIKSVVDEVEFMRDRYKVDFFGFADAIFPVSKQQGMEFCNEIFKRGLEKKIIWLTETRVDLVDEELLRMMKEAGLRLIMYGFEVGNQEILSSIKDNVTLEQGIKAMEWTKKAGIISFGLFMLGLPNETMQTCRQTIEYAKKLNCDIVKFNITVPYPGSPMFANFPDKMRAFYEPEKFTSWYDWSENPEEMIQIPAGMKGKDLLLLQKRALLEYYLRPKFIFYHLFEGPISISTMLKGGYVVLSNFIKGLRG